jgi:hypothetical protein
MSTFILTWDGRDAGYPPAVYAAHVKATLAGRPVLDSWAIGNRRGGMSADDRVFLLRQGRQRGIVAAGRLVDGSVFERGHWDDGTKMVRSVEVAWDHVLPVDERLTIEELQAQVPLYHWNAILSSGQVMSPPSDALVERTWVSHLLRSGVTSTGWTLPAGEVLGRRARMDRFGGAIYGGIQPSKRSANVFLYSDPAAGTAYGYDFDGWSSDRSIFLYTGEGRRGDQKLRAGNAAVLHHKSDGRSLRVFIADGVEPGSGTKVQRYLGEFELSDDTPFVRAEAPDEDGNARTVLVFRLTPVGAVLRRAQDVSVSGDASPTTTAQAVSVGSAATPEGSAEPVPVEALGTGSYAVAGSTGTVAVKREAELVVRYQAYCEAQGSTCVRYKLRPIGELRDLYTDLLDLTENVLYEAKGVATREAVRMAVGQLLDYSRHVPTDPSLAVLLPALPNTDLLNLLSGLRIRCVYETSPGTFCEA